MKWKHLKVNVLLCITNKFVFCGCVTVEYIDINMDVKYNQSLISPKLNRNTTCFYIITFNIVQRKC